MSRPGWIYSRMHNGWWNATWRVVVRKNHLTLKWDIYILNADGYAIGGEPYGKDYTKLEAAQAWGVAWAKEMSWR